VTAETVSIGSDGLGVGEALMRASWDRGAGLVVIGAHGRSRFAEFAIGGATRSMIRVLDRPMLKSH
jgi:nucleotide-binding universal stress UspA family protein